MSAPTIRLYPLATILSVTTKSRWLLTPERNLKAVGDLLCYMTGAGLMMFQFADAAQVCRPVLLEQHPQLADVDPPEDMSEADVMSVWLPEMVAAYGEELLVVALPKGAYAQRNPIEDLADMVGPDRVFVVPTADGDADA